MAYGRKQRRKWLSSTFLYQVALIASILFLSIRSLRMYDQGIQNQIPEVANVELSLVERHTREKENGDAQYERVCFIRLKQSNQTNHNEFIIMDGRRVVIYPKETVLNDIRRDSKEALVKNDLQARRPAPVERKEILEPEQKSPDESNTSNDLNLPNRTVVVSVACKGSDFNASLWQRRQLGVLMKSIVMLARKPVTFYLFSDTKMFFVAADQFVKTWPKNYQNKFKVIKRDTWYPSHLLKMKALFRPCSSQRLFLPAILPDVDKAIYIDTDMLFLRPIDDLWEILQSEISGEMFGGFAPRMLNITDPSLPYYGRREVNAGLFLMNLQQLRKYPGQWQKVAQGIYQSPEMKTTLGRDPDDQDILNIMTTKYPHRFYNLSCEWNYRFFMCENPLADKCPEAQARGISILHGLGHSFMNCTKAPKFCKTFQIAEDYRLRESMRENFFKPIEKNLKEISKTQKRGYRCKASPYFDEMLLKQIRKYAS